jgi:hypothetical protein
MESFLVVKDFGCFEVSKRVLIQIHTLPISAIGVKELNSDTLLNLCRHLITNGFHFRESEILILIVEFHLSLSVSYSMYAGLSYADSNAIYSQKACYKI